MKRSNFGFLMFIMIMLMVVGNAWGLTVATGKTDGGYHNKFFNVANTAMKRVSNGNVELEYFNDKGTDGSAANVKFVNSGEADVGFTQLGATVVINSDNVTAFGPVAYEIMHYVYQKGSKFEDCGDLESGKGGTVGINTFSGSKVTLDVMGMVDKDYKKVKALDVSRGSIAITKMTKGEIDGYMFVSIPSTDNIRRLASTPNLVFGSCWDGDFDEFKAHDKQLYTKISFSNGEAKTLGYPNKFTSFRVPTYIIVNNKVLQENEVLYDYFTDIASMMYNTFKAQKGADAYYP